MPVLLLWPVLIYLAGVTVLVEIASRAIPIDPAQARRRVFTVIQGSKRA